MRTAFSTKLAIKGVFCTEVKNRFLCEVDIEGVPTLCYVPSSCRMDNFFNLAGKEVLLLPTSTPSAKTAYSLFAIAYKKNYIVLNSSIANTLVEQNLSGRRFSLLGKRKLVLREHTVDGYKCDFFICDSETLVEVKSIITMNTTAIFPSIHSQRAIEQLQAIKMHLEQGKPACYIIVSLNPYVKEIVLDKDMQIYSNFIECISLGMKILGISCGIVGQGISIRNTLGVITQ